MKHNKTEGKNIAIGVALGIAIGTAIGAATDNVGLWLSLGIAIGAGLGTTFNGSLFKENSQAPKDDKDKTH